MKLLSSSETLIFTHNGASVARMFIYPSSPLFRVSDAEASEYGEEPLQLLENGYYEYELDNPNITVRAETGYGVIKRSVNPTRRYCGTIEPGLNTGRLGLVLLGEDGEHIGNAAVEVRSQKVEYRTDYRRMMEDITEQCVSLLMELRSPSGMHFAPDPGKSSETIHQRFAFLRSLIGSRHFKDALHRIFSHPHRRWEPEDTVCDIRKSFRPGARILRQLAGGNRRTLLPGVHPLANSFASFPERISAYRNIQTDDTPENRFVKFALLSFRSFLSRMRHRLEAIGNSADVRLGAEIKSLEGELEAVLSAEVFRAVSDPDMLPLGSPVLQRKEGYREMLQAWFRFDMAARLVWHGGDDVYGGSQRDIATLYEYWVFFRLLEIVSSVFKLDRPAVEDLIEQTSDGFGLKLKSGKHLAVRGSFKSSGRELHVEFGYNRTFSVDYSHTKEGSWTKKMRPDYTLSLWPSNFKPEEAEAQEIMVHVHFDAKYRVERLTELFGGDDTVRESRRENQGTWKRDDLLKMHAYRDAIRRTQGAYILYPGDDIPAKFSGFREILPGLGAFVMKPGRSDEELSRFIHDVVEHVCDRATARERQTYHIYKANETPSEYRVIQSIPECDPESKHRHVPPAETFVLVGWCQGEEHRKWIVRERLYNCRMDTMAGSLRLTPEIAAARYLLLHGNGAKAIPALFRISSKGPRVISREALIKKSYPGEPRQDYYLIFDVEAADEFDDFEWHYAKLENRQENRKSAWPYTVTLSELLSTQRKIYH